MSDNIEPKFAFGDFVYVNGYHPRIFQIDGYRREQYYYPDEQWTELVYEMHDIITAEWLEAEEQDLTAAQVDKFNVQATGRLSVNITFGEAVSMAKEPRKPTARELSAREAEERKLLRRLHGEVVDDLLDELNDYRALYAKFGDESYGDRVFAIEAELKKLTETE
jgi:hypothetical protein